MSSKQQATRFLLIGAPGIFCLSFFSNCSGKFDGKDGLKVVYFPETEIVKQEVEYKDGKRVGDFKEYYRNGKLHIHQHYVDDRLNDSTVFYFENGNVQFTQYLKDFKKEGTWTKYNEQGKVIEENRYHDDVLDGESTKYTYRTGRLLQRLRYNNGMKEGKQEVYYNNGNPKYIAPLHSNRPVKGLQEFEENGTKIDNSFNITVKEQNKLLLENKLQYLIRVDRPQDDDIAYVMADKEPDSMAVIVYSLPRVKDGFMLEYKIQPGGFVMETMKVGVFRTTRFGNTMIETKSFNVAANNY